MKNKFVLVPVLLSLVLTFLVFFLLRHHNNREIELEFVKKTIIVTRNLQYSLATYLENLHALRYFFNSSSTVTRHEFQQFVTPIIDRHAEITALEWVPVVKGSERNEYENIAKDEGYRDFTFLEKDAQGVMVPAPVRPQYYPVYFVEPYKENKKVFGYDLGSNEQRKKAIDNSILTGQPIVTERIALVQDEESGNGIIIFLPVFTTQAAPESDKPKEVQGFVVGVFSVGKLVEESLQGLYANQLNYWIFEENTTFQDPLYTNAVSKYEDKLQLTNKTTIHILDKPWTISFRPTHHFYQLNKVWDTWIVLVLGLFFSALLGHSLFTLKRKSKELELENLRRKRIHSKLKNSEEKVKRLIESAPDAILLVNQEGNIRYANKEVETVFGYVPQELDDKWHDILVPELIRDAHSQHRNDFFQNPRTRPMGEGAELEGLRKDGTTFPIEIKLSPLEVDGETQVICIARDITTKKEADDAIRQKANELKSLYEMGKNVSGFLSMDQVVNSALAGIKNSISPDTVEIFFKEDNKLIPQRAGLNGYNIHCDSGHVHTVGECLCGLAASTEESIYSINILDDSRCTWSECKNAGVSSFASIPLRGKEGLLGVIGVGSFTQRDFKSQGKFLETMAQQVAFALENALFYQKISNHADNLEKEVTIRTQQLKKSKDKAESADRLKSAFLASMSHELRTPLNSIIGFTGMLLQGIVGSLNQEQEKQLGMVKKSATHLLSLINDVLDLSKIEAGEVKIHYEQIRIKELVMEVVNELQPLSDMKNLPLLYDIEDDGIEIECDRQKVKQILINLTNNAIKFTKDGKVLISCTAEDNDLKISVVDTGIGLQQKDFDSVFETFQQTDSGLSRKYEGTGLGLSISKKLISLLGGSIWVESEGLDKGSTFSFILPRKRGEQKR